MAVVNGFTIDETGEGGQAPEGWPSPEEAALLARDYLAALPPDHFPHLIALADQFVPGGEDERFELLLEFFVDGLATRAGVDTAPLPGEVR